MTATQIQFRRGSAAQMATFTGAQGEVVVDTTNNRAVVHDGATAGGFPAAMAVKSGVADANANIAATTRIFAYTTLSAPRVATLPAAAAFPTGERLLILDESGACSSTKTITVQRAGSDNINGNNSCVIATPFGFVALESNGVAQWVIVGSSLDLYGGSSPIAYKNLFINPACDIDQRGTRASAITVTTSGARVLDGNTIVLPTGAGVTAGQAAAPSGTVSQNCLQITGAASNTDVVVRKRIESIDAAKLAGQTVTLQLKFNQNTGVTVTAKLSIGHPSSADSYGGINSASLTNEVNAVNMQAATSGTTTTLLYTFTCSANAVNGLEINIDLGALVASQVAKLTDFDMRVTPGASAGLNANPPPPELRLIAAELPLCQRHLYVIGTNGATNATVGEVGMAYGAGNVVAAVRFPASMRAVPSLTVSAASDFFALTSSAANGGTFTAVSLGSFTSTDRAFMVFTGGSGYSAGNAAFLIASDANAKLTFSAEL